MGEGCVGEQRHPPGAAKAQSLFTALPPGINCDCKYLYGFMTDVPELVGCADLIRGWPTDSTALIGLLFLDEAHQGHGLGKSAYQEVEAKCDNGRRSTCCGWR